MTISLRGGSEAWIECRSRGRVYRLPGHVSALELLLWVNYDGPIPYDRNGMRWELDPATTDFLRWVTRPTDE